MRKKEDEKNILCLLTHFPRWKKIYRDNFTSSRNKMELRKRVQRAKKVWDAICKFGWDNVVSRIIKDKLTQKQALKMEYDLIVSNKSDETEYGYNTCISSAGRKVLTKSQLAKRNKINVLRRWRKNLENKKPKHPKPKKKEVNYIIKKENKQMYILDSSGIKFCKISGKEELIYLGIKEKDIKIYLKNNA